MLPEMNRSNVRSVKKSKLFLFFIVLAALVAIIFFSYLKSQGMELKDFSFKDLFSGLNSSKEAEVIGNIEYSSESQASFGVYKDVIINFSKDGIEAFNTAGKKKWTRVASINNPVIKSDGNNILAYDQEGNSIFSVSDKSVIWNKNIDSPIINADINDNGYTAVVKKKEGYKAAVEVYDPSGSLIFMTVRSERFVISAEVMPSDNLVLLNTVDANGISADTRLELVDMQGKNKGEISVNNSIFPTVWCTGSDRIIAVNDKEMQCFDIDGNIKWKQGLVKIFSSTVTSGGMTVVAVEGNNNLLSGETSIIRIFNSGGEETGSCEVNGEVVKLSTYRNIIAANTGKSIYFIGSAGKVLRKYSSKSEIKDVSFINTHKIVIVTADKILIANI